MAKVSVKNFRGSIVVDYIKDRKYLRYHTGVYNIPNDTKYFNNGFIKLFSSSSFILSIKYVAIILLFLLKEDNSILKFST